MDHSSINLCTCNKRLQGELTSVTNMHEEISEDDSELPRKVRRKKGNLKHWKEGWIEEKEDMLKERK